MALTGFTIYKYWQQKVGQDYTGFLDTFKANRLFQDALIATIEQKYKADTSTKSRDEIKFVTKTNQVYSVNNNQIYGVSALQFSLVSLSGGTGTFTTFLPHNLITGQSVIIEGVQGFTTNPNNVIAVLVTGASTFQISVTPTAGAWVPGTGTVRYSNMIQDYWHLLSVKASYTKVNYNITITAASNTTPIIVTLRTYNNLRSGQKIKISGVLGNTAANGTFFIKKINNFNIELYSDKNLQNKVAGNGAYTQGGVVTNFGYEYCVPYESQAKIGVLNIPNILDPAYEIANSMIKFYPLDEVCSEITIDYIKVPDKIIDVADDITDLTLYYPDKFLYLVINQAAVIFAEQVRDSELYVEMSKELAANN